MGKIMFSGSPLDRCGNQRADSQWLATRMASAEGAVVAFFDRRPLVRPDGGAIAWTPSAALRTHGLEADAVFLGCADDGAPRFAVELASAGAHAEALGEHYGREGRFAELRTLATQGRMAPAALAILAQAKGLVEWHSAHPYCARCGAATHAIEGGAKRSCPACGADHFPRTDPVVIMLATLGDRAFLGRQKSWTPGLFSALAGFMEPGETIEEAVARELDEEAGIAVREDGVRYMASQPWPWPAALMIGCFAEAQSEDFTIDDVEIETGRWFPRAELATILAGAGGDDVRLPPPMAIAHQLVQRFIAGDPGAR